MINKRLSLVATFLVSLITASLLGDVVLVRALNNEQTVQDVARTSSNEDPLKLDQGDLFSDPENIGQDLYLTVYRQLRTEGSNIAITKTSGRRALTKDELFTIIPGSNIGDLLVRERIDEAVAPNTVLARRKEIIDDLAEEKDLADLQVFSEMEVKTTELFANGDESDSGFDLLVDLDIIEQLLFLKGEPYLGSGVDGRGGRGAQGRDERVGIDQVQQAQEEAVAQRARDRANAARNGGAGSPADDEPSELPPITCAASDSFNSAVERLRTADQQNAQQPPRPNGGGAGNNANQPQDTSPVDPSLLTDDELKPAKADHHEALLPCTSRFCVTIEAKMKSESAFTVEDNCILCHIEKINDAFKKTVSKNLLPNKLTGNLMEGPKCKNYIFGASSISFNFVAIPQPILTPPNDNLDAKGDFIKNFMLYIEKYYGNPGRCETSGPKSCKKDPDPAIEAGGAALEHLSENTTFTQLSSTIDQAVAAQKQTALKELKKAQLKSRAEAQSTQFNVLVEQLDTMNGYFKGFETLFSQISNPESPDSPCVKLQNLEKCS